MQSAHAHVRDHPLASVLAEETRPQRSENRPGPGKVKLFDEDEVQEYLEGRAESGNGRSKSAPPKWGE